MTEMQVAAAELLKAIESDDDEMVTRAHARYARAERAAYRAEWERTAQFRTYGR